jgi:hypothetical protein
VAHVALRDFGCAKSERPIESLPQLPGAERRSHRLSASHAAQRLQCGGIEHSGRSSPQRPKSLSIAHATAHIAEIGEERPCSARKPRAGTIRLHHAPQHLRRLKTSLGEIENAWRKAVLNCEVFENPQLKHTSVTVVSNPALSSICRARSSRCRFRYSETVTPSVRKISCK